MLYEIFKFELKYRVRRADTYIYFVFLFFFSIIAVDFMYGGVDIGLVKKNAPIIIAKTMGALTGITMMIASMIMGVPILRDAEHDIESLIFVNPIKKRDYLLGRFLGSFVILILIFSALIWGNALGEFLPWRNANDLNPYDFMVYVQPFFTVVLPILFFGAALFFISGALSKKLIVVYTQGLITFVIFMLTRNIENEFLSAILDPFSMNTLSTMTKNWTVEAKNSQLIPFNDVLLYSKLFWIAIGILIFAIGYQRFNYNLIKTSKKTKKLTTIIIDKSHINSVLPSFTISNSFGSKLKQLGLNSLFYFKSILKEISFWAIVGCAMLIIFANSISLGTVYGVDSFPATYFIIEELLEMSGYFFIIILVFYSGELIWKERALNIDQIYDALPSSDLINLLGKYIGLLMIYGVLMCCLILSGVLFQASQGYYEFDFGLYFFSFFVDFMPFLALYTVISFFIHAIVNKKFVAYILVFAFFIGTVLLNQLGYNHGLYNFGGNNIGTYSQMNGFGHLLTPFLWIKAYWSIACVLIFLIATIFQVRGSETNIKIRWKQAYYRCNSSLKKTGAIVAVLFLLVGSFIFYNTNVLNTYWGKANGIQMRIGYEKALKKFEYLPQPSIVSVQLNVELYPKTRDYTAKGNYILINKTDAAIKSIHIQKRLDSQVKLTDVQFDTNTILDDTYKEFEHHIYHLQTPLQVGDTLKMSFTQQFITTGFEANDSNFHIVHNGTFFNSNHFPSLGYTNKYELRDTDDRAEVDLEPKLNMAGKQHPLEIKNAVNGDDGYTIDFEMVLGTDANQTAIAPGNLLKKWTSNNRNYFHYKMETPMIHFYSIVSAEYEVKKDRWTSKTNPLSQPIDLEIYYHKGHAYNLERMMAAMKASFDYYSSNFSPYPYQQLRIMEFPRYAEFAQSFPTAVPFSEGLGFVLDIDDNSDVDMVSYITAHEIAHQWWGLQVVAANVQGKNMVLETLSQYSALMVLKHQYSEEKVRQFLKGEMKSYFKGKSKEKIGELPLKLVEKQEYIYYQKGAIAMYALQEYIGEEAVNTALQRFIKDWNAFDPDFDQHRYATSDDLLAYFRAVTPDDLHYVISDLFENTILHDIEVLEVESSQNEDGSHLVTFDFNLSKFSTDIYGNRLYESDDSIIYTTENSEISSLKLNDFVEIVVFGTQEIDGQVTQIELYKKMHLITEIHTELRIQVDQKPIEVGVDPYHLLLVKTPENNRGKVED